MNITDVLPETWRPYAKAVVTTAGVFFAALGAALADGSGVTLAEWVGIAATTLTGGGASYGARNDL